MRQTPDACSKHYVKLFSQSVHHLANRTLPKLGFAKSDSANRVWQERGYLYMTPSGGYGNPPCDPPCLPYRCG
jgi:hypothetical protein